MVIVTITFIKVIVIVNLILKVILIVIVSNVIVIPLLLLHFVTHTYFLLALSLHRQIPLSPDWLIIQIVSYSIVHV
jgi:hypothetical protein